MTATLLALASLLCAAFKDLSFRLFAGDQQRNGSYIAVIGLTWGLAFAVAALLGDSSFNRAALLWGAAIGLSGGISNILLVKAMGSCETAVCSTMYRLNLVPAAVLMIFIFNEPSNFMTWLGIAVATAAVWFFSDTRMNKMDRGFLLLCLASLCRAIMGLSMKGGSFYDASTEATLCVAGLTWCLCGVCWDRRLIPDQRTLLFGLGSGVLTIGVAFFLYLALSYGNGAIIIPISQLSFALTAVLAWLLLKEGLNLRQGVAISCAVLAVICLGVFA